MTNKYESSYTLFSSEGKYRYSISVKTKNDPQTHKNQGRYDFTDICFMSDVNMCFLFTKRLVLLFFILPDLKFGTLFKGNVTRRDKFICSKRRWPTNKLGVTDIAVSKKKVQL